MKFTPTIGAGYSGSLGGITAAHNRGGPYFRIRAIPTDPQTPQQMAIRGFVANLTSLWRNVLTQIQRASWDAYALQIAATDALGHSRNIGGLAHYIRSNVPRLQNGYARVDPAPIINNLGEFTNPTFDLFVAAANTYNVNFTVGDAWVNEDGSGMFTNASRSMNPSINFFKGPYRLNGGIAGSLAAPPASPATLNCTFPIELLNKTFVQIRISRADGRLSLPFRGFGVGA